MSRNGSSNWEFGFVDERKQWALIVLQDFFNLSRCPDSMMDIGGGAGSWGAAAKELGVKKIRVVDRCPREQVHHELTLEEHVESDIEYVIPDLGRFDLAISMETAEHLTPAAGRRLVERLTASSDHILSSAAIPGQGGIGHVNEQWHCYWHEQFRSLGFQVYDLIRIRLLKRQELPFWLRQNLFFYSNNPQIGNIPNADCIASGIELIRAEHLKALGEKNLDLRTVISAFPKALSASILRRLNK